MLAKLKNLEKGAAQGRRLDFQSTDFRRCLFKIKLRIISQCTKTLIVYS